MEAAGGTVSSKVIVQFSDPSGLFNDVAPLLKSRLPLGNLHWKSPTRPLRSIEELDVSLDREEKQAGEHTPNVRRHQIPGLRQTPFVRVLLLRCDDKDKYRESVRKEVKEWVKNLGFSTSGKPTNKGQERHDAFEYIILHVVIPGTIAAGQPKSSKHISLEATESTDSVNSKSKWTGKSTSTILDKLKADFSSSSKVPFERVSQIRLIDPSKPSTTLSPLELEEQWQDLVEKLKTAILQSFDARVAQYEDDIRERESQRGLPGWNFCTFFILKEGLARGFENVGLLEDAIKIYEELDLGLDAVIQDQAKQDYTDAANALLPFATDLKDIIRTVLEGQNQPNGVNDSTADLSLQAWTDVEASKFPWKLERRNYQQMILTNHVSALDFRIYIFIRQMQIMLRRAGMSIPLPKTKMKRQSGSRWDADLLSEVCERSIKFMNLAARNLRQDLFAAWGGQEGLPEDELETQKVVIDIIVASWKWSSLIQTLSECQITGCFSSVADQAVENPVQWVTSSSPAAETNAHIHERGHSMLDNTSTSDESLNLGQHAWKRESLDTFSGLKIVKGSKVELLFWAAELFTALRTVFLQVSKRLGVLPNTLNPFDSNAEPSDQRVANVGLRSPSLRSSISSESNALEAYKLLTMYACHCYISSGKPRATRQLLFDLARLDSYRGDYEAAGKWLDTIPDILQAVPVTVLEHSMLELYIECLQKCGRDAEMIQALLLSFQSQFTDTEQNSRIYESLAGSQRTVDTKNMIDIPFRALFDLVSIDSYVGHDSTTDETTVVVVLRPIASLRGLSTLQAKLEYRSRTHNPPAAIMFNTDKSILLSNGLVQLSLRSQTSAEGWYEAVMLHLSFNNATLRESLEPKAVTMDDDENIKNTPSTAWPLYMYPRNGSPQLEASHAHLVDLSSHKYISVCVTWGSNAIETAHLRLKPATAGLRLDVGSTASTLENSVQINRVEDVYFLVFEKIGANTCSTFQIPYSFDDAATISGVIRAEMHYTVGTNSYDLYANLALMTLLPISVSVQDYTMSRSIFSRFTFAPSRLVPISILDCNLEGDANASIVSSKSWPGALDVYPRQPASWTVQIVSQTLQQAKFMLEISYRCLDEMILDTVTSRFLQAILETPYTYATRPLCSHFKNKMQTIWTEQELELALLTSEVELWGYEELDWATLLHAFRKPDREAMEDWLKQWHLDHRIMNLQIDAAPTRRVRLLVEPPRTQLVVTTELTLLKPHRCVIGRPTVAQLVVFTNSHTNVDAELTVEIIGQGDTWLVGGHRKIIIRSSRAKYENTIIILAQRTGNLLLPNIDVKCRDYLSQEPNKTIPFELDNKSAASMVRVRSEVESTTLGFGESEGGESHWLIDNQTTTKP